jgi:triosephosphate isomerase
VILESGRFSSRRYAQAYHRDARLRPQLAPFAASSLFPPRQRFAIASQRLNGHNSMATKRRPLVAGNWKMNGLMASAAELDRMIAGVAARPPAADVMVCPPATLIATFASHAKGRAIAIGGQDCHAEKFGAFTGDISAEMLQDAGASAVIVGHSERRTLHHETDADVRAKALAAWRAGLLAIVCVGETDAERIAGRAFDVVTRQLAGSLPDGANAANTVIAYEPVWAIGTGKTPTTADVAAIHGQIRARLSKASAALAEGVRILYGGSVKPSNAAELMAVPDVDGALVGGASLKADEFLAIVGVYR